ncbi:MAG TPA: TonB-dependent receptor [Chitinophaga sp.]
MVVFIFQARGAGHSQGLITLNAKNKSLKNVLESFRQQSGYHFIYSNNVLQQSGAISVNLRNAPLDKALQASLKGQPLRYTITDSTVTVRVAHEPPLLVANLMTPPPIQVTGVVTDSATGKPLPGVSLRIKGTSLGTNTKDDGSFQLNVQSEDTLVISYVGYNSRQIPVQGRNNFNIILTPANTGLNEIVVVGYGSQKRESVTGSIATVQGAQLNTAPVGNITNSLAGRLPGLISLQSSGQPGFDAANISIRGFGNALMIVDGIETSFNAIDPSEIESVSILKDGAASIYGARAGNGVILVTTKRGHEGKPSISLGSSYSMQGITTMPNPASAGQYAELIREQYLQSGQPEANVPYTEEQVQKYYAGGDPQYPNTNWRKVLIKNWAPMWQHNIAIRGGTDKLKYYGYVGYEDQKTIWMKSGGDYNRYNVLSNLDARISDNFSLQFDVASTVANTKYPPRLASTSAPNAAAWQDFWNTVPIYPATLPDPTKNSYANGGGTGGAQLVTNMDIAGYAKSVSQDLKGTVALNYVSHAIEGLSAKALVNYLQNYTTGTTFEKPYSYYTYDYATNTYNLAGGFISNADMRITDSKSRTLTGQFSINYDHTFNKDHQLKLLGLYEVIDYYSDYLSGSRNNYLTDKIDQLYAGSLSGVSNDGSASTMGRASYVARLNYSFRDKYLLESSVRADASAKFPADKRWGYFPSVSVGWQLAKEKFMRSVRNLDELKIRASYGSAGDDGVGNFQYLTGYQIASDHLTGISYLFGNGEAPALIATGLANPELTWEKIKIYNGGIDFSLWNRKLYGSGDVFFREETGIPATATTSLPASFGAILPPQNLNSLNNRGFELVLGTAGSIHDLHWDVSGNISWSRAKWEHYEEPDYTDPDQKRIYQKSGHWTDETFGYLSDGLFTSQAQIDHLGFNQDNNFTNPNSSLRPGDIRYKNMNGDSILDWRDEQLIGKGTTPHWMYGFNLNLSYKNFDFSTLMQGAFGYYKQPVLSLGGEFTTVQYNNRWTTENNDPHAIIPRFGGVGAKFSDYLYKKAGYMRVKSLALGYTLPRKLLTPAKISTVRVYFAGTNLFTFDKLKQYRIDPEAPSALAGFYYPQQRTLSFGLNVSF